MNQFIYGLIMGSLIAIIGIITGIIVTIKMERRNR